MTNMQLFSCNYASNRANELKVSVHKQKPQIINERIESLFYQTLRGIIIPPEWKSILTKDGKKLSRGALELYAIIVSWYNYKKVVDKNTGAVTFARKFEGEEFRKNYKYFTKELDRSQEQVRRYFAELKSANLLTMELRSIWHKNWKYPNTICIKLNTEAPHFIKGHRVNMDTNPVTHIDLDNKKIWSSPLKKVDLDPQKSGVYIENNYSKTNIMRSDLEKSDFVEGILSNPLNQTYCNKNQINKVASLEPAVPPSPKSILKTVDTNLTASNPSNFKNAIELGLKVNISDGFFPSQLNNTISKSNFINFVETRSLLRKPLSFFYPLSEEDAVFLRRESGRPFSLSFINKLLLKLSADYPDRGFYKKSLLLSYLTSSLIGEKRDACVVSCESFKFQAKLGSTEYTAKIQNDYLNTIELSPDTSIPTKIKRRIIGLFDEKQAYNIITCCYLPNIIAEPHKTNSYKVEVPNSVTDTQRLLLTQAIRDVLKDTTEVIFEEISDKKVGQGSFINASNNSSLNSGPAESIISSSPIWQKIRESLAKRYGEAIDKSWFSKCDIEVHSNNNQILIKAPSNFMRDWIKQNYSNAIEEAVLELSKTTKELLPNFNMTDKGYNWLEWSVLC